MESRRSLVFVARRLAGTATLRACQLFDASTPSFRVSGTEVTVPVSLLLEPGDAPPMEASLKSKLLFRRARARLCRQAAVPGEGESEERVGAGAGAPNLLVCKKSRANRRATRRDDARASPAVPVRAIAFQKKTHSQRKTTRFCRVANRETPTRPRGFSDTSCSGYERPPARSWTNASRAVFRSGETRFGRCGLNAPIE